MAYFKRLKEPIIKQTNVALQITRKLLETEFHGKNMIYSPQSIHSVLSLIAAKDNCPQLLSFLKAKSISNLNSLARDLVTSVLVDSPTIGGPRLNFTNGVWVDESVSLEESYKKVVLDSYKAALNHVDIKTNPEQVRSQVNAWVGKRRKASSLRFFFLAQSTLGRVSSSQTPCTSEQLGMTCTLKNQRQKSMSFTNGGSVKGVPFMTSEDCHSIGAFDGFKVMRLPFQ
ncbi:hypothetical protein ACLB2K_031351 [Fragaria x ananassa]